ncbi:hypothetical protein ACTXPO_05095 [Psychrobacter celer]|uniref:hypothetical protein n=1 Tax=Psychrobacter TaxID=497 RepID=UPI00117BB9FD|nr:hypothetical protein [Psychrobacter sp. Rd 27.2]
MRTLSNEVVQKIPSDRLGFFIGDVFYENDFCGSGFYKTVLGSYLMSMVDAYLCNNLAAFGGRLSDRLSGYCQRTVINAR